MTYEYRAVIRDVHDGDTVKVDVDLGWGVWLHARSLRLVGLNAPELNTAAGKEARDYLTTVLPLASPVTIRTELDKTEKFGRMLATIWDNDRGDVYGDSVNDMLIRTKHAVAWDGKGPRP